MEQILAQSPVGDERRQIARTRRNDAHVDMDAGRAADALEILIDENAQDLALRFARHVGDFVEIERAAMGLLQRADACARAPSFGSTPKSSISIVSGAIVAALMTTKGPPARAEASWIERAASSLPTPGAPVISTREFAGADALDDLAQLIDGGRAGRRYG